MSTNHLAIPFSLKSPADAKALADDLPPMMPEFFRVLDDIGTVHYSRFSVLDQRTLTYLADFDGEFGALVQVPGTSGEAVFDTIFKHVANPPLTPVPGNAGSFMDWAAAHLLHPVVQRVSGSHR